MKKRQKIEREVQKAHSEIETPINLDYLEISMTPEQLDFVSQKLLQKYPNYFNGNDPAVRKKMIRRQERLLRKIFKAASQVLTDDQFSIFTSCYIYQIPDKVVSQQLGRHQTYITQTLRESVKKIQKRLRIEVNLKEFSKNRRKKETK